MFVADWRTPMGMKWRQSQFGMMQSDPNAA